MLAKIWAKWVMNHRFTSIALVVLGALLLGMGAKDAQFSANQRDFFKPDDKNLNDLIRIEEDYTSDKNVMVLVEPHSGNVFTPDTLKAIQQLTEFGWSIPHSQRVESLSNHLYTRVNGDELTVDFLVDDVDALSPQDLLERKRYATGKTGVKDYLVTRDGGLSLVSVILNIPEEDNGQAAVDVIDTVHQYVDRLQQQYPAIDFRVVGGVAVETSLPAIVQEDGRTIFPFALVLVFLFLTFTLRDLVANLACIVTALLAIMAGMGAVLWSGVKVSPILVNTPSIIIIIAMADCIHLMVNYAQGLARGLDKKAALEKSVEVNFSPIIFTSLTTAISFFALNFSESPPFAHMGTAAGVGILYAMLASLTFLPALIYYLPSKARGVTRMPNMGGLIRWYQPHANKIIIGFVLIMVSLASLIPMNRLDDNFVEFFDEDLEVRRNMDFMIERISGSVVVNISIPATENGGIYDPQYLNLLQDLEQHLQENPQLRFTTSLLEVMKTLNKNLHEDSAEWYRVPDSRELASQYLLMYEMSLPFGQDLSNLINFDRSESRVIAVYDQLSDKELIDLEQRIQLWLDQHQFDTRQATIGSANLAFAHMQYSNVNNLSKGFVLALIMISLLLIALFRSWKLGLISMVPNLFPAAMAFGIWALISGKIGFGMSVGITITLGIVVDDTIHFLAKYKYAREQLHLNNYQAVQYAMDTVGVAMLLTTAMMAIAFTALLWSDFIPNQDLGLITIITIVCALLVDLVLLPILLLKLFGDNPAQTGAAAFEGNVEPSS
ncbi:MAG: efflux RND transporter permease subunit [Ketobacter sp.]